MTHQQKTLLLASWRQLMYFNIQNLFFHVQYDNYFQIELVLYMNKSSCNKPDAINRDNKKI
jgi:hypothetical protein